MKYIIEHMEESFSPWVVLEYKRIASDVGQGNLILSSVKPGVDVPAEIKESGAFITDKEVDALPDVDISRVCLLDPSATQELVPDDKNKFDYFLFGGILGDHPPRDRTGELRRKGFTGRHLDKVQMTTDTAVRVTQLVLESGKPLESIDFIDFPELRFNKYESTEMPFRYVKDANGEPIMPEGMRELIEKDGDKNLDDLL